VQRGTPHVGAQHAQRRHDRMRFEPIPAHAPVVDERHEQRMPKNGQLVAHRRALSGSLAR
jgi:hypothetical protein